MSDLRIDSVARWDRRTALTHLPKFAEAGVELDPDAVRAFTRS